MPTGGFCLLPRRLDWLTEQDPWGWSAYEAGGDFFFRRGVLLRPNQRWLEGRYIYLRSSCVLCERTHSVCVYVCVCVFFLGQTRRRK